MKKICLFIIFYVFTLNAYCQNVNITGETIVCPQKAIIYTAANVNWNQSVRWKVTNGQFWIPAGTSRSANDEWTSSGPNIEFVGWDDIAEKGSISYTVVSDPANTGYADIEILSVQDSQVDSITMGNFKTYSDTVYIPKGVSGLMTCEAHMIFPATRNGSQILVTNFKWELPLSLGGNIHNAGNQITVHFDANSGDNEKIIITPIGCESYNMGIPRTFTIKRFEGIVENRNISGTETYQWNDLIIKNVNILSGANVTFIGSESVQILPEFHAYPGSLVHISSESNELLRKTISYPVQTEMEKNYSVSEPADGVSQNYPNPCHGNTSIDYCLAETVQNACIYIVSATGEVVKNITLQERRKGTLDLNISGLSTGFYLYYLVADGQMSGSKRMIVSD